MQSAPRERGISSFTCRVNCDVAVSGTALRAPNASECVKGPGERGLFLISMFVFDSGGPGVYVGMFGCMYKHADRHVHLRDHRSIYIDK